MVQPMMFYAGLGLIAAGLVQLIWFVRTDPPRHFAAQAAARMELGIIFLVPTVVQSRTAGTIITATLGVGFLISLWLHIKLLRQSAGKPH